jgi:hypothetical protein
MKGAPVSPSALAAPSRPFSQASLTTSGSQTVKDSAQQRASAGPTSCSLVTVSTNYPHSSYLTITQDPYPPLNHSPDFFDPAGLSAEQIPCIIDCIDMEDFDLSDYERTANAHTPQETLISHEDIKKE